MAFLLLNAAGNGNSSLAAPVYVASFMPTNHYSPYCPLCCNSVPAEEAAHHVLCYADPGALSASKLKHQGAFYNHLIAIGMAPPLTLCLWSLLLLAWARSTPSSPLRYPLALHPTSCTQLELGWDSFLIGQWMPMWFCPQACHFQVIAGSHWAPKQWLSLALHKLLYSQWRMWDCRNTCFCGPTISLLSFRQAVPTSPPV